MLEPCSISNATSTGKKNQERTMTQHQETQLHTARLPNNDLKASPNAQRSDSSNLLRSIGPEKTTNLYIALNGLRAHLKDYQKLRNPMEAQQSVNLKNNKP